MVSKQELKTDLENRIENLIFRIRNTPETGRMEMQNTLIRLSRQYKREFKTPYMTKQQEY